MLEYLIAVHHGHVEVEQEQMLLSHLSFAAKIIHRFLAIGEPDNPVGDKRAKMFLDQPRVAWVVLGQHDDDFLWSSHKSSLAPPW